MVMASLSHSSKGSSGQLATQSVSSFTFFPLIFILISSGVFLCFVYFFMTTSIPVETNFIAIGSTNPQPQPVKINQFLAKCSSESNSQKCMTNYPKSFVAKELSAAACPEYFRWIHEDLRPWKSSGISREMLERAKEFADFRLVIVEGKAYVEKYRNAFATRDLFTVWGILQLLRLYPGRVPDLELMFSCGDRPRIYKNDSQGSNATLLPVMFQYCGTQGALGVLFPDWSFWGWAEVNVKPWASILQGIIEGNKRKNWKDRVPYAYWKGNSYVNIIRDHLMKCNVSNEHDWNARLYQQNWTKEANQGFKHSNLEDQCTHRYKIYIEGWGWSVSEKYILACDSMVLFVKPKFYDFFTRSMLPLKHYWPIRRKRQIQCRDIKLAVQWGNNHPEKARAIGKAGSRFIQENLKMKYVYDYMFHVLSEYAKLLKLKPIIPKGAAEVCSEIMACSQEGLWKKFMMESMVKSPSETLPCTMPPPYDFHTLETNFQKTQSTCKSVETWVDKYWEKLNMTQYAMPSLDSSI